MKVHEVNFDGLIGFTHNYAGLSAGNFASQTHSQKKSHPKTAALEGLAKMEALLKKGFKQGFLPPHNRPIESYSDTRKTELTGFLEEEYQNNPLRLAQNMSASAMWTANAATVTPSWDSLDKRCHMTVANLMSHEHRKIESDMTERILNSIFNKSEFVIHPKITEQDCGDEGAANHMRLALKHELSGINIFTYNAEKTHRKEGISYRQSLYASQRIVKNHQLNDKDTFVIPQNSSAVKNGAFHNDVIATANESFLMLHEHAFDQQELYLEKIKNRYRQKYNQDLFYYIVKEEELSLKDCVQSYLFNSQILTESSGEMILIAPIECKKNERARSVIQRMISKENPLKRVEYFDLNQSMCNGGGPACLRLRVLLNERELSSIDQNFILDQSKISWLKAWIKNNYLDKVVLEDLISKSSLLKQKYALQELEKYLNCDKQLYQLNHF